MSGYAIIQFQYVPFDTDFFAEGEWWQREDAKTAVSAYGWQEFQMFDDELFVGIHSSSLTNRMIAAILAEDPEECFQAGLPF